MNSALVDSNKKLAQIREIKALDDAAKGDMLKTYDITSTEKEKVRSNIFKEQELQTLKKELETIKKQNSESMTLF